MFRISINNLQDQFCFDITEALLKWLQRFLIFFEFYNHLGCFEICGGGGGIEIHPLTIISCVPRDIVESLLIVMS